MVIKNYDNMVLWNTTRQSKRLKKDELKAMCESLFPISLVGSALLFWLGFAIRDYFEWEKVGHYFAIGMAVMFLVLVNLGFKELLGCA